MSESADDAVALRELDREIQDLVRACSAHGERTPAPEVARLGLALADLTRRLPVMSPGETRDYFVMVESLARAALVAIQMKAPHEC